MAKRSYRTLFCSLAVIGLLTDQATKYGVFRWLYDGTLRGEREVVVGWFRLTAEFTDYVQPCDCAFRGLQTWSAPKMPRVNHGALFGLGGQHEGGANHLFAAVSILAAAGIIVWATRRTTATDGWLSAALGLILGGTVGNLYDRVVFNGVRDFLYFYHEIDVWVWRSKEGWPVFNIADCCLVAGAGMLLTHAFLFQPKNDPQPVAVEPVAANVG